MNQRTGKSSMMDETSHRCSTGRHPHCLSIQRVEMQRHAAPARPMSRRKKESRTARSTDGTTGSQLMADADIAPCEEQGPQLYKGGPRGKKVNEAVHITDSSSPLSVFLLFFAEVSTVLVVETNRYRHHYLDTLDNGPSPVSDVTEYETCVFLAITARKEHCVWDHLAGCWAAGDQFYAHLYRNVMKRDRDTYTFFRSYTSQTTEM
jgi:hypothetical protein